jgi:hypothetical protein
LIEKKDKSDINQNSKKQKANKCLEDYNRNMFMCAALNAYSKAKGYKELMFMRDFENLLDKSKIELFSLFNEWSTKDHRIIFNNENNKFFLE